MVNDHSLSLYMHIPFCTSKCDYCDFTSFPISNQPEELFSEYFNALKREFKFLKNRYLTTPYRLTSLYIGGGTPSVVPFHYYESLFEELFELFPSPLEFTCEVNPGSVSGEFLKGLRDYGCTRISLGMQSPSDQTLESVGRLQTINQYIQSYSIIRAYFSNVNIDLICGLPEDLQIWLDKCGDWIAKMAPKHCSVYILEAEKDTPLGKRFRKGIIELPSFEYTTEIFKHMIWQLTRMGYHQYEISNFSQPGYESLHNHCYWESKNYLGLGVSAGGFFNQFRYVNTHLLSDYLSAEFENEKHYDYYTINSPEEHLREFLFMGLRLKRGVFLNELNTKFPDSAIERILRILADSKYMTVTNGYLRLNDYYFIHNREAFEYLLEVI